MSEQCSNCGQPANVIRGSYRFVESGLDNVTLENIELVHCDHCGNEDPIIPRINEVMRLIAVGLVKKPWPLTGKEVRYLRKYLHQTGEEFGRLLHTDKTVLSKWENDQQKIGEQTDRLIRAVAVNLGEGLESHAKETVAQFKEILDDKKTVEISLDVEALQYEYA